MSNSRARARGRFSPAKILKEQMITNLTPHIVTVRDSAGIDHVYPTSGFVARVEVIANPYDTLEDGTPVSLVTYGRAELPPVALPEDVRRVVSDYYGTYPERGEGNEVIYVRAPAEAKVTAAHSSRRRVITIDGVEYEDDARDALLVGIDRSYIVSTMFADAYRAQHQFANTGTIDGVTLYVPDSGPSAIRENGQIVAVRSLILR